MGPDVLTVQEVAGFTGQSECHDQLARDLIREKSVFTEQDASRVARACETPTAADQMLRQLDEAIGNLE